MKQPKIDWQLAIKPLLKKYKNKEHPLKAKNLYEIFVLVVLSSQTTDNLINQISGKFFEAFPDVKALAKTDAESLYPYINKVRSFRKKAGWLVDIAKELKNDENIPKTMATLVKLPGIGRKSANVIMREAKAQPEGIIVDLHVLRVAPRLGIAVGDNPEKIEKQLMEKLPKSEWDVGMAISFLGREICRPTPECPKCLMRNVCAFYNGWK